MRLLAVSEHYFPRVGGTVNYVHETLCALAEQGVEAELLVPGPAPEGWLPAGVAPPPYKVTWLDAGYPPKGDPSRAQRYDFCQKVDRFAKAAAAGEQGTKPDVLHVLFGMFVMELLDTAALGRAGLPTLATVHNVPPMECRQIAQEAPLKARLKEALRLQAVTWKNRGRLKRHSYTRYIVPSEQVAGLLRPIVGRNVEVIGHGTTSELQAQMRPPADRAPAGPARILTVGGYVPHKRQHIIPETAARLRDAGVAFHWDIAGPPGRVKDYFASITRAIAAQDLGGHVTQHPAVPFEDLAGLYDQAHLYVQPSIEEGFCITALDAAAAGLPVIGARAGALPDIVAASGGRLVASSAAPLAEAIGGFLAAGQWPDQAEQRSRVALTFSWNAAAAALLRCYTGVLNGPV